jgi:hypothetical protein
MLTYQMLFEALSEMKENNPAAFKERVILVGEDEAYFEALYLDYAGEGDDDEDEEGFLPPGTPHIVIAC